MSRCALILCLPLLLLAPIMATAQPGTGRGGPPGTGAGGPPGTGAGGPAKPGTGGAGAKPPANNPPGGTLPGAGLPGGGSGVPGGGAGAPATPAPAGNKSGSPGAAAASKPPVKFLEHDLDFWIDMLSPDVNRDAAVRELAIHTAIPIFGPDAMKKAMPKIVNRLQDPDPTVRLHAMKAICEWGIDDPTLKNAALTRMFSGAAESVIRSSNDMLKLAAVNAAAHIGTPAALAIPVLADYLRNSSSYELRKAAAAALGQVGREDPKVAMLVGAAGVQH